MHRCVLSLFFIDKLRAYVWGLLGAYVFFLLSFCVCARTYVCITVSISITVVCVCVCVRARARVYV